MRIDLRKPAISSSGDNMSWWELLFWVVVLAVMMVLPFVILYAPFIFPYS